MYKDALLERTILLALGVLAIWGAKRQLLTWQAEQRAECRRKTLAKELEEAFFADRDFVSASEEQYHDGWEQHGKRELARHHQAKKQEFADRVLVRNMVRKAVDHVVDTHYEGVARKIQEFRAATLEANEQTRRSNENIKDMREDMDVNAEAFRHYGFQQGFGGSWVLPSRV